MRRAHKWLRGISDILFPPVCVHCRSLVPDDGTFRHLCPKCVSQIDYVQKPYCCTCGHPFYGVVEGERICPHCEGLAPAFNQGATAVLLKGPARALVHELKYHRGLHVLGDMEQIFARATHVLEVVRDAVVVPVPLHPRKHRERTFNQSELVAEALVRVAGGATCLKRLLHRTVDTVSQTHHDRRTRQSNLKNAFALASNATIHPEQHYLLVDDVFTTGSTLNSCAQALRRAGALNLDVVTFGHG
jgi:ComF family protein